MTINDVVILFYSVKQRDNAHALSLLKHYENPFVLNLDGSFGTVVVKYIQYLEHYYHRHHVEGVPYVK